MQSKSMRQSSALEPLKVPQYRAIWFAALGMNTGLFVQDVAAAWLMTSLSTDPMMIALMQTAAMLPFFLLGIPAGALADLIDRRKLLLAGQIWSMAAAGTLAFLTINGHTNAWVLLGFTCLLFVSNAMCAPAWSAVTPELVPKEHLEASIGLGSAGYNLARGFGAAIGGAIVAACGAGWAFATNGASYLLMFNALLRWDYKPRNRSSSEKIVGAMRAGVRYVRHSRAMRAVLVRTVFFTMAVSIMWSLLPLLAREHLHVDSFQYGIIVSGFGFGTLFGAVLLPRMRLNMSLDTVSLTGTMLFALAFFILAFADNFILGVLAMFICGIAWATKNSALNVAVQLAAPNWVRARAYSVYLVVFQGCTAIGAMVWGAVAQRRGMSEAFVYAGVTLLFGMLASIWYKLSHAERLDVNASTHWEDPELNHTVPREEDGPVMITVEYIIDAKRANEFLEAIHELEVQRRRDGAYQWHVFRDLADERKFSETFLVETWGEHVRQHERVLISDRATEQKVDSFHTGPGKPEVKHLIAASPKPQQVPIPEVLSQTIQTIKPMISRRR